MPTSVFPPIPLDVTLPPWLVDADHQAWWERELGLILTIPGVTSNGSYGDVQLPDSLPTAEAVSVFMRVFNTQYSAVERVAGTDNDFWDAINEDVPTWFQIPEGEFTIEQESLLTASCRMLSSWGAGFYVYDLRKNRRYPGQDPQDWGSAIGDPEGAYRSFMDRLFDRLHVNHSTIEAGCYGTFRMARAWPAGEGLGWGGEVYGPLTTYFAPTDSNLTGSDPQLQAVARAAALFQKMRQHLASNPSAKLLGVQIGGLLYPAASMVFPLDWRQAGTEGLFGFTVDINTFDLGKTLREVADLLSDLADTIEDEVVDSWWYGLATQGLLDVAVAVARTEIEAALLALLASAGISATFEDVSWNDVLSSMPVVVYLLNECAGGIAQAATEVGAVGSAYYLFRALDPLHSMLDLFDELGVMNLSMLLDDESTTIYRDLLTDALGLDWDALESFMSVLEPLALLEPGQGSEPMYPTVVWLGDSTFLAEAREFNHYEYEDEELAEAEPGLPDPSSYEVASAINGRYALTVWDLWYQRTLPTLDAARVFDTAGLVAMRIVQADDLLWSIASEKDGKGALADAIKAATTLSTPYGAVSLDFTPAEVVRYLVRQLATDIFIEYFVRHEGADRETLYKLFCWMDSEGKRTRIGNALGEPVEVQLPEEIRALIGRAGWSYLPGRGAFDRVPATVWIRESVRNGYDGGLGAIADGFVTGLHSMQPEQLLRFGVGIYYLTTWIADSRQSCLPELANRPDWDNIDRWNHIQGGIAQWELTESPSMGPLAGWEWWNDLVVELPKLMPWLSELPENSLSPVGRALRRQLSKASSQVEQRGGAREAR